MKIVLSQKAHRKISYWVAKADFEVSGFGKVTQDEKTNTFHVHDVYLLKQTGGAAHTEIDATSMAKLMFTSRDIPGFLNFWWHSHVNMDVFWSGQDKTTIEELGAQGFCVATVFNKRKEMRSAVCAKMAGMIGSQVTFWDSITTEVQAEIDPDQASWDAEYLENVQEKKWPSVSSYGNYGQYQGPYDTWTPKKEEKPKRENKTVLTQGLDGIPYWAQLDAELLGMDPQEYWTQANNGDYYTLTVLDDELDKRCREKYKVSYHDWQKSNWRA